MYLFDAHASVSLSDIPFEWAPGKFSPSVPVKKQLMWKYLTVGHPKGEAPQISGHL